MIVVARPALARYRDAQVGARELTPLAATVLAAAFTTSAIGIHEIFGPFVLGAIFPRGPLADEVRRSLEALVVVLLPVFFVTMGLNVDIGRVGWGKARGNSGSSPSWPARKSSSAPAWAPCPRGCGPGSPSRWEYS